MKSGCCPGGNCEEVHRFDGRKAVSLSRAEFEDLVMCYATVTMSHDNANIWEKAQAEYPGERVVFALVLKKEDVIDTKNVLWRAVPESVELIKNLVRWEVLTDPETQVWFFVYAQRKDDFSRATFKIPKN